ncbi:aminodeoxychorismate/anthranilate synthase component II [Clostridium sp.]|uniref:anthranilate synthase component II n=1 Tax=Clostridium sp. TaxID=1506 RepID=UPI00258DC5C7|nr:aminodeoxychorismate/anthranilate synthase component II [Clostridium sp.]MDF2503827.1 trpGD1 [Clostridium sp.]
MILIIDNYDSFTYNLYQYIGEIYTDIKVVRNDEIKAEDIESMDVEGIILSPGPGTPEKAGICVEVIKRYGSKIPILGICLGHQAIGYAYGGNIVRAKNIKHGKTSDIKHNGEDMFQNVSNPIKVMRYHSLVVDKETFPKELTITAESLDDGVIMGLKHKKYDVYGLQFHPESIITEQGKVMIKNFVEGICNVTGSNKENK